MGTLAKIKVCLSGLIFLSFIACVEKVPDFTPLEEKPEYSLEIAYDVEVTYSDSAKTKVKVKGPVSRRYVYRFTTEEEFPDGVAVEFYDPLEEPTAWLTANYAMRKPDEKMIIARDSVVMYNAEHEKLETHELIWDEKAGEIYTDRFVKITRPDEIIYSRGFKTNQEFSRYELQAVEGDLIIEQFEKEFDQGRQ
jgi:LPS export ABC transporter protein LptC